MWVKLSTINPKRPQRSGFTIVELLIVIVVIGILAAITIVAFNGVQKKAQQSSAQSAVSQANKKVLAYAAQNSDQYPSSLEAAGITNTDGMQYSYNNDISPRTYGITAVVGSSSYYVSNLVTQPTAGGYAGHAQNGIATIKNLHTNPRATTASGFATQTPTGSTAAVVQGTGPNGDAMFTVITAAAGQLRMQFKSGTLSVQPGETYQVSYWLRSSTAVTSANVEVQFSTGWVKFPTSNITANLSRYNALITVPAGVTAINNLQVLTDTSVPSGAKFEITDIMVTAGSTLYTFADGTSTNWAWDGQANNSTSTGIPL